MFDAILLDAPPPPTQPLPGAALVHGVGPRVGVWLRAMYPKGTRAKAVAADFGISVSFADKLLRGYNCRLWLFEEMVARWDGEFLRHVFAEAAAADDQRIQELEEQVRALRAELDGVRAARPGMAETGGTDAREARLLALALALAASINPAGEGAC